MDWLTYIFEPLKQTNNENFTGLKSLVSFGKRFAKREKQNWTVPIDEKRDVSNYRMTDLIFPDS